MIPSPTPPIAESAADRLRRVGIRTYDVETATGEIAIVFAHGEVLLTSGDLLFVLVEPDGPVLRLFPAGAFRRFDDVTAAAQHAEMLQAITDAPRAAHAAFVRSVILALALAITTASATVH